MEKKKIVLKKEKKKSGIQKLLKDRDKRYIVMLVLMLPFIIALIIFSIIASREAKTLINLAKGDTKAETKPENIIESMDYILRDNPTELQRQYFDELKEAIEGAEPADDATIAGLVAKNYIADFYTWTNKNGQYDIGGFYYLYDGEYENGDHYKENIFLKARNGFYKYISVYGTQYGKENLLEVENVDIISCQKTSSPYYINEHIENRMDENGEWYDYRETKGYDCYIVKANWSYKDTTKLNLSQFATSINLAVIKRGNRFEIVEASENNINARTGSETNSTVETTENTETTTASES